jgi:hypothetical protein
MALIMTVYNMKRAINILGIDQLLAKLQTWKPNYKKASAIALKPSILRLYKQPHFLYFAKAA